MTRAACTRLALLATVLAACGTPAEPPGPVAGIELLSQAPEVTTPGQAVAGLIVARVVDDEGAGRPGLPVTWAVEAGGGRVTDAMPETGLDGLATARWTAGPFPGAQSLAVSVLEEGAARLDTDARAFSPRRMDAGNGYLCGIVEARLWCAGSPVGWPAGQEAGTSAPVPLLHSIAVKDVASGDSHICVLDLAGQATCLSLYGGPLGQPPIERPAVPALRYIASGDGYFCGIADADQTPWCWSLTYGSGPPSDVHQVSPSLRLQSITAGNGFGCGLDAVHTAWCWRSSPAASAFAPRSLGAAVFRNLSAAGSFACGATEARTVVCLNADSLVPSRVVGLAAEWVECGYFYCLTPSGTGVMTFSRNAPAAWYTEVGFVVARASADDDLCVQGRTGEVYCDGDIARIPAHPFPGQWYFAIPSIEESPAMPASAEVKR